jgi:hypothetical protein
MEIKRGHIEFDMRCKAPSSTRCSIIDREDWNLRPALMANSRRKKKRPTNIRIYLIGESQIFRWRFAGVVNGCPCYTSFVDQHRVWSLTACVRIAQASLGFLQFFWDPQFA